MPSTIFISYSHKDEEWKERVVTHLQVIAQTGQFETWDDRRIEAGEDWQDAISQAIEAGSLAILLVSANSLTSQFILTEEVPRLLELRASGKLRRLVPVILKPCPWKAVSWVSKLNVRPKDGKPLSTMTEAAADEALADLAMEISRIMNQ